ncbi:Dynein regulatory complex protein 11 [Quaeritorhiza haematococci]|nr:Dynein regulatory complex protein 11 [Quaeritorhiza haematococci]
MLQQIPQSADGTAGGEAAADAESKGGDKKAEEVGGNDKKKPGSAKKQPEAEDEASAQKFKFDASEFLDRLKQEYGEYIANWSQKNESDNFAQKHDQEIVKSEKRKEVEAEIKAQVFEVLKEELKNLKLAVEREKGGKGKKKGKKGKSAKGKKKSGKKGSGKGKKGKGKGKKEKDLTANRTMESLVEELVQTGLLQKYPPTPIKSFVGDFNLLAPSNSKAPVVEPTLSELQRCLTEYCVLPMCIPITVPSVTSMLLFGPRGTGKTMLINAIATETGAHLFNLSPRNTAGQFVGKSNVSKMVHMVFKVAKAHAPSIIYIDGIESIFAKKLPKDEQQFDPKRIKKDLLKYMKTLTSADKVVVIATSYKPWDADPKAMIPLFEKILFCPKPDYASRWVLWKHFISRRLQTLKDKEKDYLKKVNLSILTRMSTGMTAGMILTCVERAMVERRLKLMRLRPLTTDEFVEQMLNLTLTQPQTKDEDKVFKDWFEKTPLLRRRAMALAAPTTTPENEKGKGKGKKDAAKGAKGKGK